MFMARRDVLKVGAAAACTLIGGAPSLLAGSDTKNKAAKKPRIGVQLYCVRGAFGKDVPGTLKALAKMGYQGVEFWGYGGTKTVFKQWTAKELRKILDDNGIACCGIHLQVKALDEARFAQTVEVNKILGNPYLIVAAAAKQMSSPESIKKYAALLNAAAVKAKKLKMRVGYHAHGFDFKKFDGKTAWDLLFSQTTPDVVMQLDTGNAAGGGGDPLAILKKFPGRATTLHIKEFGSAKLGKGDATWEEIIKVAKMQHKTKWYIVEQGGRGGNELETPKACLKKLKELLVP